MNHRSFAGRRRAGARVAGFAVFALIAGAACSRTIPGGNSVAVTMTLPVGMWTNIAKSVGRVEIWLDESGAASPFSSPTELAQSRTSEGLDFQYQIADVDGDGKYEFWMAFPSSPFGNGRTKTVTLTGSSSFGTFNIHGAIFRQGSNALLATAKASVDISGYAIQFSGAKSVNLQFECEPLLNCPVPVDGGAVDLDAGPAEGNVVVTWNLPAAPQTTLDPAVRAALGPIEITFDETGDAGLFASASQKITARTYDGVAFERQVADVDGDGRLEFYARILQNPFNSLSAWPMSFAGTSSIAPFALRARLYSNDGGTIVAEATATTDIASVPIQFGGADRYVNLNFACLSEAVCKTLDAGNVFVDAGADAGGDAGEDAGPDGGDGGADADADAGDAGADADAGAEADAGPDAGEDAGAGVDAGADAGAETDAGAEADAGADAGAEADAGADAGADGGSDAGIDAGDDASSPPPLSVTSVTPTASSTNAAITPTITVFFDTPIDAGSLSASTFYLSGNPDASIFLSGKVATLTPLDRLDAGASYTATVTTGVVSTLGGTLASNYSWSFTTQAALTWAGTREIGTNCSDWADGVVRDSAGNIFLVGRIGCPSTFMGVPRTLDAGYERIVVVKYDSSGAVVWTRRFGSNTDSDDCQGIAANDAGDVFLVTSVQGAMPGTYYDGGATDTVVTKLSGNGEFKWHTQIASDGNDWAGGIAVGRDGYPVAVGYTRGGLNGQTNGGNYDAFVVKLDPSDGGLLWTTLLGGTNDDVASGVAVDADGGIVVAGYSYSNPFDGISMSGRQEAFVTKFSPTGSRVWSAVRRSDAGSSFSAVTVLSNGEIVAAGSTTGAIGGYSNLGDRDMILERFTAAGASLWTRQDGTSGYDALYGIGSDSAGNAYAAGCGTGTFCEAVLIKKIDPSGNVLWTRQLTTTSISYIYAVGVAVSPTGDVWVGGNASGSIDGGAYVASTDYFVVKYNTSGTFQ